MKKRSDRTERSERTPQIRAFKEAVQSGYRISHPRCLTKQMADLTESLGDGYHNARLHCWNIAHRVIGDGGSEAVYPTAAGRDFYVAELWKCYCSECAARVHGIEYKDVRRVLRLLKRKYIEHDPVFNEDSRDPSWTVAEPGYSGYQKNQVSAEA